MSDCDEQKMDEEFDRSIYLESIMKQPTDRELIEEIHSKWWWDRGTHNFQTGLTNRLESALNEIEELEKTVAVHERVGGVVHEKWQAALARESLAVEALEKVKYGNRFDTERLDDGSILNIDHVDEALTKIKALKEKK